MEINYHAFRKNHCQLPGIYSSDAVCSAALWTPADIKDSPCEKPFQLLPLLISNLLTLKMIWWNKHCLKTWPITSCLRRGEPADWTPGTSATKPINSSTFITSFTWANYHISSMIWKQSKKPQYVLSDAQLKDVKLGFLYTVLVLAVNASNIILKRTHLAEKRDWPGSLAVTRGLRSLGVCG